MIEFVECPGCFRKPKMRPIAGGYLVVNHCRTCGDTGKMAPCAQCGGTGSASSKLDQSMNIDRGQCGECGGQGSISSHFIK